MPENSLVYHESEVGWPEILNLLELLNPPLIRQLKSISEKIKSNIKYIPTDEHIVVVSASVLRTSHNTLLIYFFAVVKRMLNSIKTQVVFGSFYQDRME